MKQSKSSSEESSDVPNGPFVKSKPPEFTLEKDQPDMAPEDKPSIIFFDSMNSLPEEENIRILRQYVELEFIEKKATPEQKRFFENPEYKWQPFNNETMPCFIPYSRPTQDNYTDCGLFLLEYVETFLLEPDFLLKNLKMKKEDVSAKLFSGEVIKDKRDVIKRLCILLNGGCHVNRPEGCKKGPTEETVMGSKYRQYRDEQRGKQILYYEKGPSKVKFNEPPLSSKSADSEEEAKVESMQTEWVRTFK